MTTNDAIAMLQSFKPLTVRQTLVFLHLLHAGEKIPFKSLARIAGIPSPSLSRALDRLNDEGMTLRTVDENKRNRIFVSLTEKGQSVARIFE